MNSLMIPIDTDDFKRNVKIRFNNILDGFDTFKNFTISADSLDYENLFINFVTNIFKYNSNYCYIDFYLSRLNEEDKKKMISLSCEEDAQLLKAIFNSNFDTDFFKIENKDILPLLVRLSAREIFFITFYFTEVPVTIWGNYNMRFPCFTETEETLEHYKKLASDLGILDIM